MLETEKEKKNNSEEDARSREGRRRREEMLLEGRGTKNDGEAGREEQVKNIPTTPPDPP